MAKKRKKAKKSVTKYIIIALDGVIRLPHPRSESDVVLVPGIREVLQAKYMTGHKICVFSNMDLVSLGFVTKDFAMELVRLTERMLGVPIDKLYLCFAGAFDDSKNRLPKSGMFGKFKEDYKLKGTKQVTVVGGPMLALFAENEKLRYLTPTQFRAEK